MRIPRSLAWVLLVLTLLTSGLIRQFNEQIPTSPYVNPAAGSLLFAAVVFLLLVTARERRTGPVGGEGIRLGSLTPLLLMLLGEKWVSLALYNPVFYWITPRDTPAPLLDAYYRAFSGAGLLAICLLAARFSAPTARRLWRRSRAGLWPWAAIATLVAVVGAYALLGGLAATLGSRPGLWSPAPDRLWAWTFGGQALRAFSEEVYYRGLLLFEIMRLAPRLGLRRKAARRWVALGTTSALFGLEHVVLDASSPEVLARQFVFTVALGLLLGIVVLVGSNIHLAAGLHAWINWLLLGVVPRFVDGSGQVLLPPGTYIGISLVLAFVVLFLITARRRMVPV